MQQVPCPNTNMTITARLRHLRCALTVLACAAAYGCASVPDDSPVVEQLDDDTGITVARLGRPIELYRDSTIHDSAVRFAFLGPFETNRMGTRELYLWIAAPIEFVEGTAPPVVEVNGTALALGTPNRDATSV